MSRFDVNNGAEELMQDLQKLGKISEADHWEILTPASDLLVRKFAAAIKRIFRQNTGKLAASIQGFRKSGGGLPYMLVYPYGTHHKYKGRTKTRQYKRSKHGRTYTYGGGSKNAEANDVGFVLEYGSPARGIKAYHWMENTLEENSGEISEALQQGFDEYCDKRGIGQ